MMMPILIAYPGSNIVLARFVHIPHFFSRIDIREAWRWWEKRQIARSYQQAEQIREGALQDLFALRRSLELAVDTHSTQEYQSWLSAVEHLHHKLEYLSYALASPYSEENLPLAIQYHMKDWQNDHPSYAVQLDLPASRLTRSPEQNQIIIKVLDELLQLAVPDSRPASVQISLQAKQLGVSELRVQILYESDADVTQIYRSSELQTLQKSFEFLMSGQCIQQQNGQVLCWHLRWQMH